MTKEEKDKIVAAVRAQVDADCPPQNGGGLCLFLAVKLCNELGKHGIRAVLQAGSAQWKCMAIDDGVSPTHFAYMWEMSPLTKLRLSQGKMPEMHCWVGLPDTQEIVDISTRDLVMQAKLRADITWTANPPPDYIWSDAEHFPDEARYIVDPLATIVALSFAKLSLDF